MELSIRPSLLVAMNLLGKSFQIVVWLGILANWSFAAWAIFNPTHLLERLESGSVNSTIWLFNDSVLLAILSCFYMPSWASSIPQSASQRSCSSARC